MKDWQQFQINLLQCSCKPLDRLLVQQASKLKNTKISSFVKELLLLFIIALWEKTQINPTTYYTYGRKKKTTHLDHLLYLWQHKKMDNYWILFIVDVINDCHNNLKAVKGRQQKKKFIVKMLVTTCRSETSDCVLCPLAYLQ